MNGLYSLTLRYFLILLFMLLLTGLWMFIEHTNVEIIQLTDYYAKKSFLGLLETISPHLFAMGTILFIVTHFLALERKNTRVESVITVLLFIVMLLSNLSTFFIGHEFIVFSWVKLIFTLLFILFSLFVMLRVFFRTR